MFSLVLFSYEGRSNPLVPIESESLDNGATTSNSSAYLSSPHRVLWLPSQRKCRAMVGSECWGGRSAGRVINRIRLVAYLAHFSPSLLTLLLFFRPFTYGTWVCTDTIVDMMYSDDSDVILVLRSVLKRTSYAPRTLGPKFATSPMQTPMSGWSRLCEATWVTWLRSLQTGTWTTCLRWCESQVKLHAKWGSKVN